MKKTLLTIALWTINAMLTNMMNGQTLGFKVGILVAMEKERGLLEGLEDNGSAIINQCGIGKVNAAVGCMEMIREFHPDIILSLGCAGGNGDGLQLGDVVVSTETVYHDVYCGADINYGQVQGMPARYECPKWLVEQACKTGSRVVPGLIVSGDWFVDSKEKMADIIAHFPEARAVDMESAAIAQVCHKYQIPFVSLRIISDLPMSGDKASQYVGFWDTVSEKTFTVAKNFVTQLTIQK